MPSLTMDQFNYVLRMGLDSKNRRFATEMDGTRRIDTKPKPQDTGFYVGNKPVDIGYIKSVIDAVGPAKFLRLNPWAVDLIRKKSDIEVKFRKTLDASYKDFIDERVARGWTRELAIDDYEAESRRARVKFARDKRAILERARLDASFEPSNLYILDSMYKFGKDEKPRHYDKKKAVVATN